MTQTQTEIDNLDKARARHKWLKFHRAWFNMKLTRRNRPDVQGYRGKE